MTMIDEDLPAWTPKMVSEQFVAAIKWVRRYGGSVGPAGIRSGQPAYLPSYEELLEDFGIFERADDEEERRTQVQPSPEQISRFLAALEWPADYLIPAHDGSARMLGLWAYCKATRSPFDQAVADQCKMSRGAAYALRDRALSIISQGLTRDEVRP
jgi:hypothetical protein